MSTEKQSWRLFVPGPVQGGFPGGTISLTEDEHHYAFHVLRLQAGACVEVGDGHGFVAEASLVRCDKKGAQVEVLAVRPERRFSSRVTLLLAQPKPSTLEEVVVTASELGVHRVVVFRSQRCQSKAPVRVDKLERLSLESLRITKGFCAAQVAFVENAAALETECANSGTLFLCDESPLYDATAIDSSCLASAMAGTRGDVGLIVGPEASFTDEERVFFREKGARPVSLGPLVLRVPTAVSYATSVALAALNPRWAN